MAWAAIAGAVIGAISSAYGARQQNKQAQENAQAQMDFQERMSSTSYQRSMADMRAAGLNPMLASHLGGATTPGGTAAPVINPMGTELSGVATTALATRRMNQELKSISADIALKTEQTKTQRAIAKREIQWSHILDNNTELQMLMRSGSLSNTAFGMASYHVREEMKRKRPRAARKSGPAYVAPHRAKSTRPKAKYFKKKAPVRFPQRKHDWNQ